MIRLPSGPRIGLHIEYREGSVICSSLSLAETFTCQFSEELPRPLISWLEAYAARLNMPLPPLFALSTLSSFQQSILALMAQIPLGETRSYGELAAAQGTPSGARAVGGACNRNPFPLFYPCHRVVQKGKGIGGFAVDLEIKRRLLEFERVSTK